MATNSYGHYTKNYGYDQLYHFVGPSIQNNPDNF